MQDFKAETSTRVALTTLSSGPYAGLQSAKKRPRESVILEEDSSACFGPVMKAAKKAAVDENVNTKEKPTASFGPPKKIAKRGGVLKNV